MRMKIKAQDKSRSLWTVARDELMDGWTDGRHPFSSQRLKFNHWLYPSNLKASYNNLKAKVIQFKTRIHSAANGESLGRFKPLWASATLEWRLLWEEKSLLSARRRINDRNPESAESGNARTPTQKTPKQHHYMQHKTQAGSRWRRVKGPWYLCVSLMRVQPLFTQG